MDAHIIAQAMASGVSIAFHFVFIIASWLGCCGAVGWANTVTYNHPTARLRLASARSDILFYCSTSALTTFNAIMDSPPGQVTALQSELWESLETVYIEPQSQQAQTTHPIEDVDWGYWERRLRDSRASNRSSAAAAAGAASTATSSAGTSSATAGSAAGGGPEAMQQLSQLSFGFWGYPLATQEEEGGPTATAAASTSSAAASSAAASPCCAVVNLTADDAGRPAKMQCVRSPAKAPGKQLKVV